jgi:hypothetical protein
MVLGPSICKLNFSQESGIIFVNVNVSPYLAVSVFEKLFIFV